MQPGTAAPGRCSLSAAPGRPALRVPSRHPPALHEFDRSAGRCRRRCKPAFRRVPRWRWKSSGVVRRTRAPCRGWRWSRAPGRGRTYRRGQHFLAEVARITCRGATPSKPWSRSSSGARYPVPALPGPPRRTEERRTRTLRLRAFVGLRPELEGQPQRPCGELECVRREVAEPPGLVAVTCGPQARGPEVCQELLLAGLVEQLCA